MPNAAGLPWGAVLLGLILPLVTAGSQAPANPVTRAQFEALLVKVDNSSRWGAQDQMGTLNFITADVRRAATTEVRDGTSISLARDIQSGSEGGFMPTTLDFFHVPDSVLGPSDNSLWWAGEKIGLFYHGWGHTHIDALSHLSYKGRAYNGRSSTRREGPPDDGHIGAMRDGLISRGVLIDIPLLRGAGSVMANAPVSVDDLTAWERKTGVRIRSGDIVVIRSGRWAPPKPHARSLGIHPTVAVWLHERGVAVFGDEGGADMLPSPVPGVTSPFHVLAIAGMGMPLIDNLDLERLASEAATRSRWTFLFMTAPLRIQGGTGSPLNPIAVF